MRRENSTKITSLRPKILAVVASRLNMRFCVHRLQSDYTQDAWRGY